MRTFNNPSKLAITKSTISTLDFSGQNQGLGTVISFAKLGTVISF